MFENCSKIWPVVFIICSAKPELPCESNDSNKSKYDELQRKDIEKVDSRIILHIFQVSQENIQKVVVLSSDIDVVVLLLYYWKNFKEKNFNVKKFLLPIKKFLFTIK